LRFGPRPIHAPYLISQARFVACHQWQFLERYDVLQYAAPNGIFLLNSPYGPDEVWEHLPREIQESIVSKDLFFYVIDAQAVAQATGMGRRINTIMQTCFFAISGVLERDEAILHIKESIRKTYSKRGESVVERNFKAVDETLVHLYQVNVPVGIMQTLNRIPTTHIASAGDVPEAVTPIRQRPPVPAEAPAFVRDVLGPMIAGKGDDLPVSALPCDGTYPTGTTQWEKRNIALDVPIWDPDICIQCGKCAFVCPHAVIRMKLVEPSELAGAPETFRSAASRYKEFPDLQYVLQISPEDCTGCSLCVEACPAKDKSQVGHKAINMTPLPSVHDAEVANWDFFAGLPTVDRTDLNVHTIKNSQLLPPLFEFSGACAGCGETPYLKLMSQLFGDRAIVANATGCSSIYGGNLPTTPWTTNDAGRGPAWANSLFEDNAEFGLGMRITIDKQNEYARELLARLSGVLDSNLIDLIIHAEQRTEVEIAAQRERVALLKLALLNMQEPAACELLSVADALVWKSVWIVGGDGWAYDIGYGGLDHVLASGRNVNVLVLDTEVYSNTGGQASKSTPRGAVAKFAANGKSTAKKDLALLAMSYGSIYVARVAMGASDQQTLTAFLEAEAYDGPSLIIAYSHCIAHGYDLKNGLNQQKLAVQSGHWPTFRFNPDRVAEGKNPLILDAKPPTIPLEAYAYNETRYTMLRQSDEERATAVMLEAKQDVRRRWHMYQQMATIYEPGKDDGTTMAG
jgi:pyruvate-ferredoxin/flavodoxin oxidoreductase